MKKLFLFAFVTVLMTGCFRLDDNLYNISDKITSYKMDGYNKDLDFRLDDSYKIPDSLIHVFTLESQAPDESSPTTIYAEYVGDISKIATDTVIMYCHGNKWNMDFYWQRTKLIANTGWKDRFGVMTIDYRGYGLSHGKPTEDGMYADVNAALKWLKMQGLTNDRLIMYGYSLGTAPATKLTAEPRSMIPAKLILQSPFASAAVMVQDASVLAMPSSFFTNLKIDNAEEIKSVQQPFLWMHGLADDFINIKTNGEVIYANYQGVYKEAHRIPGAGHSNLEPTMGYQNYSEMLLKFITR